MLLSVLSDESEASLLENCSRPQTSVGAETTMSSATDEPQTASVTLGSVSSASGMTQTYPPLLTTDETSAVEDVIIQSPYCSSSSATSQSDVDIDSCPLPPNDNADYSVAAKNVSASSDSYQHCRYNIKPFTAVHFDTPPADIGPYSEDDEQCSGNRSVTGLRDSGSLVESNKNKDKVASSLSLLPYKYDPDCPIAEQSLSYKSSHLPHSSMTCAAVAASTDNSEGKDAADSSNRSSQFHSVEFAGHCSDSAKGELPGSECCSAVSQTSLDSASSGPEYAGVSLTERGFSAELSGPAAPLSPEYDV